MHLHKLSLCKGLKILCIVVVGRKRLLFWWNTKKKNNNNFQITFNDFSFCEILQFSCSFADENILNLMKMIFRILFFVLSSLFFVKCHSMENLKYDLNFLKQPITGNHFHFILLWISHFVSQVCIVQIDSEIVKFKFSKICAYLFHNLFLMLLCTHILQDGGGERLGITFLFHKSFK